MTETKNSIDRMVEEMKDCAEFRRYRDIGSKIQAYPEKKKRLFEFRKKNYQLQNSEEQIDLFSESDRLMKEYQDVYDDPMLREFLEAEVAACRLVQRLNFELAQCLEFEELSEKT
ncbi:MAG: YlbF family regulator [Clostridiales bacterium]|nr:YlbF family regulator [Clostridiales bacterium]